MGRKNQAADALSRLHEDSELNLITHSIKRMWKEELEESLVNDEETKTLIAKLVIKPINSDGYSFDKDELKKMGRYYVGNSTDLRKRICDTMHNSSEGGHSGVAASIKITERIFFGQGSYLILLLLSRSVIFVNEISLSMFHHQGSCSL